MSIINKICEAIYAELIRENANNECLDQIQRILVDHETYCEIRKDSHFRHWCQEFWDETDGNITHGISILGHPIVPTYEVKGFEILLRPGIFAPKAARDTAQD